MGGLLDIGRGGTAGGTRFRTRLSPPAPLVAVALLLFLASQLLSNSPPDRMVPPRAEAAGADAVMGGYVAARVPTSETSNTTSSKTPVSRSASVRDALASQITPRSEADSVASKLASTQGSGGVSATLTAAAATTSIRNAVSDDASVKEASSIAPRSEARTSVSRTASARGSGSLNAPPVVVPSPAAMPSPKAISARLAATAPPTAVPSSVTGVGNASDASAANSPTIDVIMGQQEHTFLKAAFRDISKESFVSNVSSWWEPQTETEAARLRGQTSQYASYIHQDLSPWQEGGITEDMVNAAAGLFDFCDGDMLRFQIINGSLWVQHVTDRLPGGWYPAQLGAGKLAGRGRIPHAILALLDMLRLFPGQVPDVDAVLHAADFTCVPRTWPADINASLVNSPEATAAVAAGLHLPVLGYQGSATHLDLPFPDFSYYGSEYGYIEDPWGRPAQGWAVQSELLHRQYADVSLVDRLPRAVWRGRTQDQRYPQRDALRRTIIGCERELREAGRVEEAALLDVQDLPVVGLQDVCDFRFNLYLESQSYASNLKQKLVCGSVLVAPKPEHWEFFTRSLRPGEHYVEVTNDPEHVCEELVGVLRDMNAMLDTRGKRELPAGGALTPKIAEVADALRWQSRSTSATSAALGRKGGRQGNSSAGGEETLADVVAVLRAAAVGAEEPVAGAGGRYSWGSGRMPWEIAAAGQRFVREQVRNQDALLYMRDLLRAYASLQRFQPIPTNPIGPRKARCYTGDLLLQEFGFPHPEDEALVERAYPWLRGHDGGCKEAVAAQQGDGGRR